MSRTLPGVTQLLRLPVAESTQTVARFLAAEGAPAGTLVWADRQTAGRGRLERTWTSPKGNLYFSWILRPSCSPRRLADLGLAAAGACASALGKLSGREFLVKPPNDVYALERRTPKKVCGILAEASGAADRLDWLVLGVGVNVNAKPAGVAAATSLRALAGRSFELEAVLAAALGELGAWLAPFGTAPSDPK